MGIISRSDCSSGYPGQITTAMVCAGFSDGNIDSCSGDSGGPLVALVPPTPSGNYELVGATSWGRQCALAGFPGVYSDVFQVIGWVRSTTGTTECPRSTSGTTVSPPGTTAPPPTGCATVSGADPGQSCVFPFRYGGTLYNECIFEGNAPGDTEPWCSTLTDSNDDHVGGQGNWGFCASDCPVIGGPTSAPPTTPPTCQDDSSRCASRCNNTRKCDRRNFCRRNCDQTCGRC